MKHTAKHKMNAEWQEAADEAAALIPAPHASAAASEKAGHDDLKAESVAGIQRMFDAIADAGTDPKKRLVAALRAFAANTNALADGIEQSNTSVMEGVMIAFQLLTHTLVNFKSIRSSVVNGHKK